MDLEADSRGDGVYWPVQPRELRALLDRVHARPGGVQVIWFRRAGEPTDFARLAGDTDALILDLPGVGRVQHAGRNCSPETVVRWGPTGYAWRAAANAQLKADTVERAIEEWVSTGRLPAGLTTGRG